MAERVQLVLNKQDEGLSESLYFKPKKFTLQGLGKKQHANQSKYG